MLEIQNICFSYHNREQSKQKLDNIISCFSLNVAHGEVLGILGKNGCGKSTLLHVLAGIFREQSGAIMWNGVSFDQRQGQVGYIPQKDLQFPWLVVTDNIALPLRIRGWSKAAAHKIVHPLLKDLGLYQYRNYYPEQLSGGMRQRVSLLRGIVASPDILLMDEPFSQLDYFTRYECIQWTKKILHRIAPVVLYVSHDLDEMLEFATRIVVVSQKGMGILADMANSSQVQKEGAQLAKKKEILALLSL